MRVQFDYTQADMVDVSKRLLARSRAVRGWRWQGLFVTASITWLLVFFFLLKTPFKGALIASLAALISALIYLPQQRRATEKRLGKLCREKFGDKNNFVCEVELSPDGILITHVDGQITCEWGAVEDIVVTADTVDIFARTGGVVVRDRAFRSVDERREFVALAQNYVAQARHVRGPEK
jgi:hypothetical protein